MKSSTCCFTGHRFLPAYRIGGIIARLNDEIDTLYRQGVYEYISGGAIGFDQIAASAIINKRETGLKIHLTFALPHKNQEERWKSEEVCNYQSLLLKADNIIYVSQEYTPDCFAKRNRYMIDHSSICICALLNERTGTGQTVRYALKNGIRVINVMK